MTWFGWLVIALQVFSALVTIAKIDQPRRPTTPADAVAVVIIAALFIWGYVAVGTR